MFGGLVWLQGSGTSVDDPPSGYPNNVFMYYPAPLLRLGGCSMQPELDSRRSTIEPHGHHPREEGAGSDTFSYLVAGRLVR